MSHTLTEERLVLTGILQQKYPEYLQITREKLKPDYFTGTMERKAFQVILKIAEEMGTVPGQFEVEKALRGMGVNLEEVVKIFREADKQGYEIIPPWDFNRWVNAVREGYFRIQAIEALSRGGIEEAKNLLIEASQEAESLHNVILDIDKLFDRALREGNLKLINIGFLDIDKYLKFSRGRLLIIGGKAGSGKSALLLNILLSLTTETPVGLISIEMDKGMVVERINIQRNDKQIKTLRGRFYTACPDSCTLGDIERIIENMKTKNSEIQVIGIDFLQLMRERVRLARHEEVSFIVRGIKRVAKKFNIGIILVSQLSRSIDQRGPDSRPTLSDLKESGDVEYAGDCILFIHRKGKSTEGELILAKNRQGRDHVTADVLFDGEKTLWRSRAIEGKHYNGQQDVPYRRDIDGPDLEETQRELGYV